MNENKPMNICVPEWASEFMQLKAERDEARAWAGRLLKALKGAESEYLDLDEQGDAVCCYCGGYEPHETNCPFSILNGLRGSR